MESEKDQSQLTWQQMRPGLKEDSYKGRNIAMNKIIRSFKEMGIDLENPQSYKKENTDKFLEVWNEYKLTGNKGKPYATTTKVTIATILQVMAEYFNASPKIVRSLNMDVNQLQAKSKVDGTHIKPLEINQDTKDSINRSANAAKPQAKANMKILAAIDNLLGVLRFSDITRTKTIDEAGWNYLDLDNGIWYIRSATTKARFDRKFKVPKDVINVIREWSQNDLVLSDKLGKPMNNENANKALSNQFKRVFGFPMGSLRKGDAQHTYETADSLEDVKEKANILGHSVKTQLERYVTEHPERAVIRPKIIRLSDDKVIQTREVTIKPTLSPELRKAIMGRSASKGGLNMKLLRIEAEKLNVPASGTRKQIQDLLKKFL
jgi:hypothetical protein